MQYWYGNTEEVPIDLWRLLQALWKRIWIIIFTAVIFGTTCFIYSAFFVTPTYRASFTAYVNNRINVDGAGSTSTSDLNASIGLTYLYEEIITSRSVLTDAADNCGLQCSYPELSRMVKTSISESAAIITVFVEDTNPERAAQLATAIAEVAPQHVARVVDGSSMRIVDAPVKPTSKFAPNNARNAMIGAIAGIVLAISVIVIVEIVNDTVKDGEELEKRYQIVVVGDIPDMQLAEKTRGNYGYRKVGSGRK